MGRVLKIISVAVVLVIAGGCVSSHKRTEYTLLRVLNLIASGNESQALNDLLTLDSTGVQAAGQSLANFYLLKGFLLFPFNRHEAQGFFSLAVSNDFLNGKRTQRSNASYAEINPFPELYVRAHNFKLELLRRFFDGWLSVGEDVDYYLLGALDAVCESRANECTLFKGEYIVFTFDISTSGHTENITIETNISRHFDKDYFTQLFELRYYHPSVRNGLAIRVNGLRHKLQCDYENCVFPAALY